MKLNLLPTTEKKSRAGKFAFLIAMCIVLLSIFGYGAATFIPLARLKAAKEGIPELEQQVANADATSKKADTIIATATDVIRNAQLAQAMIDHNDVNPKLYDDVKKYIPPYFRVQSMQAQPVSAGQSVLTIRGTLTGYQRYADLMLAMMRFKDATTVTRQGYVLNDPIVPGLDPADQQGKMRRANEGPVPDDDLERLAYFQTQAAAAPTGYQAAGGFGSGTTDTRGALPDASIVTITLNVTRDLRVPLATETLSAGGGAAPATAGFGPPAGFGGGGLPPSGAGGGRGGAD